MMTIDVHWPAQRSTPPHACARELLGIGISVPSSDKPPQWVRPVEVGGYRVTNNLIQAAYPSIQPCRNPLVSAFAMSPGRVKEAIFHLDKSLGLR